MMNLWHWNALFLFGTFCVVGGSPPQVDSLVVAEPYPVVNSPGRETLKLECTASGDPKPTLSWKKDGKAINKDDTRVTMTDKYLQITNVDYKIDSGNYQCLATNTLGTVFKEVKVDVLVLGKFEPPNTATAETLRVDVTLGKYFILKCPQHTFAKPQIYFWGTLPNNQKPYLLDRTRRRFYTNKGDLVFAYVTAEDVELIKERFGISCLMYNNGKYEQSRKYMLEGDKEAVDEKQKPTLEAFMEPNEIAMKDMETTLVCGARGRPTPTITWYKDGVEVTKTTLPGSRFQGEGVELVIGKPRELDSGKFKCVARNSEGDDSKEGMLHVQYKPEWTKTLEPVSVLFSQSHTFNCSAIGVPDVSYEWYKNGEPLTSKDNVVVNKNVLQINKAVLADSGMYICLARNTHGSITAQTSFVVQPVAPKFTTSFPDPYYLFRHRTTKITCNPSGGPAPTIEWFWDGKPLTSAGRYKILSDGSLEISSVEYADKGTYKCKATNVAGSVELVAKVEVVDPTVIVSGPINATVKEGSSFQLICDATFEKKYPLVIEWYKDDVVFKGFDKRLALEKRVTGPPHIIIIKMVETMDRGKWTCYAYTQLKGMRSEDRVSGYLKVPGPPDPPNYLRLLDDCGDFKTTLTWQLGAENGDYIHHFIIEYSSEYEDDVNSWYVFKDNVQPGTTTQLTLDKLTAYANLRFRIIAVNSIGPSKPSAPTGAACVTPPAPPAVNPTRVRAVPSEANKLKIEWDPVKRIHQNGPDFVYEVGFRKVGDKSGDWQRKKITSTSFEVPSAGVGQPYEVYVRSFNSKGPGPEPKTYTVYSGQDKPSGAPSNLRVTRIASTSVEVAWDPVVVTSPGNVAGYVLYYWTVPNPNPSVVRGRRRRAEPDAAAKKKEVNIGENGPFQAELADLKAAMHYNLVMTALNSGGEGPGSDILKFETNEAAPGMPSDVTMTVYGDALRIKWKAPQDPNGRIVGYVIETDPPTKKVVLDGLDQEYYLTGLEPLKYYTVRIQARNSFGPGAYYERKIAVSRPDKPGKPEPPTVERQDASAVKVSFLMPNYGGFPSTVKTCYQAKGEQVVCVENPFPKTPWIVVSNISLSSYEFWTTGINAIGEGETSEKTTFTLKPVTTSSPPVRNNTIIQSSTRSKETPWWKTTWLIVLVASILFLLIVILVIICLLNRAGGKYGVAKREKDRAGWNSQPINDFGRNPYDDDLAVPLTDPVVDSRPPPKYPSQNSLEKKAPSDENDSLGDYEDDTNFNEDGSFIGQYGDEKRKSMDLEEKV